jgi:hypothetical protein
MTVCTLIHLQWVESYYITTDEPEDYDPEYVSASSWELLSDNEGLEDKSWSEINSVVSD